jgi:DNA polymerase III epsilon subunit family exonuclease
LQQQMLETAATTPTYVAFDLETTGLSARSDRIIEIGAVKFTRAGVADTFSTLVDPGQPVPLVVQRLCGLHDSDLQGQPSPEEAVAQLAMFCEGCELVGHGIGFDLAFCSEVLPEAFYNRAAIDTSELARTFMPLAPSHSLEELSTSLDLIHDRPHRALSDAEATRLLLWRLVEEAALLPSELRSRVRHLLVGGPWHSGTFMAQELALRDQPRPPTSVPVAAAATVEMPQDLTADLDPRFVGDAFGPQGLLAAADPLFELREEQQQMALAVTQALRRGQRLLVEAGTGVGKSLAYLLPAREWAARRHETVVISTHTITLQEQLLSKDVPLLDAARPLPIKVSVLKGRGNYLSLRRMERWLRAAPMATRSKDADELRFKVRLLVWAYVTRTGDRSELRLAGRDPEFWERVASTVDDCLGPACHNWRDRSCFMARARLEARESDVVIVNHALLLTDADSGGSVLPEFHHLVVDEAHHLEEAATQAQGRRLSLGSIVAVLDRIPDLRDGELGEGLKAARQGATAAFGDLKTLIGEDSSHGYSQVVFNARLAGRPSWARSARSLQRMVRALEATGASLRRVGQEGRIDAGLFPQPDNAARECVMAGDALLGMARLGAAAMAAAAEDQAGTQVAWAELERGARPVIRTAPVEVASSLRERLFDQCESVVLTSATLAVAGSFAYIRARLGMEGAEELVLDSPFDYLRQSLCCLPRGVPGHGDPRHGVVVAQLVADIAERLGGRTLVLFTGYQSLRDVHHHLRGRLQGRGIAVLGQGLDGTRNQLLRNFRRHARTVLLGTNSFWEGIDLPGEVLQCVVIDKLPFPVPSDPVFQARAKGMSDSFSQLSLPEAVLRLKQGFGRLVRGHGDRGAVVICDPRILEKSYGDSFVRALPRATFNYDPVDEVGEAVSTFLGFPAGAAADG